MPIGGVPVFVQKIIMYFPISHTAVLFRKAFMTDSVDKVFKHASADQIQEYEKHYGIVYKLNGHFISTATKLVDHCHYSHHIYRHIYFHI